MSPNGRRRWRLAHRRARRSEGSAFVPSYKRKCRWLPGGTLPPLSRPAFTARSLVGASNTCRKWLARVDLLKTIYGEEVQTWDRRRAKRELIDWSKKLAHPIAQDLYRAARKLNRVGERLRPCPGCPWCEENGWTREEDLCEVPFWRLKFKNKYGVFTMEYPDTEDGTPSMPHCNGNGLLPARKARKARR